MLLSLCELCLQEDNIGRAGEFAREALALASRLHEGANVAEAHIWLGRIADKLGDADETDREFALAIQGVEKRGRRESLFPSPGVYAEVLEPPGQQRRSCVDM